MEGLLGIVLYVAIGCVAGYFISKKQFEKKNNKDKTNNENPK